VYEERQPKILRTLLTGRPSPSSIFWSWVTFGINMALLAMTLDVIYRAQIFHPHHHASFGRIGYVSENYANILVREPYAYDVKVLYRSIDEYERSWMKKMTHSSQPKYWLTGDTDFTTNIKLDREYSKDR
jgi:alkaline phosphatase D